jgi:hypothetical protein
MGIRITGRNAGWMAGIFVVLPAALIASLPFFYISQHGGKKLIAVALAGMLGLLIGFFCGNLRLLSLWALLLVAPIDLSKRFGPIFLKMGGESSFRVEVSDLFIFALFVYLCLDISAGRLRSVRIPRVTWIWLAIVFIGFCWAAFGTWRTSALQESIRMCKVIALFIVLTNELMLPGRIFHCAAGITLGMLSEAIVGIAQFVTHKNFGLEALGETGQLATDILASSTIQGDKVLRVGGFLQHPNVFGIFLAMLLPFSIGMFLLGRGKYWRLYFLASTPLALAALVFTLSRSGWTSFVSAFLLLMSLMFCHPGLRRRTALASIGAGAVVLLILIIFSGQIGERLFSSNKAATLGREEYIHDAWGMIKARPILGWGMNSYVFAVPPFTKYGARGATRHYQGWIPPVHNIYFLWWSELGIVGLLLHLTVWGSIIATGLKNLRVKDKLLFTVNVACLGCMLALLVDGMFSFSLRFNSILREFWIVSAMILAIRYLRLQSRVTPSVSAKAISRPLPPRLAASGFFVPREQVFLTLPALDDATPHHRER